MFLSDLVPALQELHRTFHESLAGNLRALQDTGSVTALVSLVAGGFLYGVLHAIGPGHGKVVIGAYMFADTRTLRQGLLITALSSLLQAAVAVTLVLALFLVLGLAHGAMESAAAWMEWASLGLLAAVGVILVVRGAGFLRRRHGTSGESQRGHHHPRNESGTRCRACGHAPSPQQLRDVHDLRGMAAVVASVGLRPCSGALLLMTLACLAGQIGAGIAATLAMGVGTGLSVAAVAIGALRSRRWLLTLVSATEERLVTATGLASILGGVVLIASAVLLLVATVSPAPSDHPAEHKPAIVGARTNA
jgi:ABC-type nickel/cobalt efflux system permease component RcnA